ncbi:MAG: primosomal protein N', partial [Actinomycetia bacterium]|nr:primosomal protein N' [Actinomycetes bacterium]
MSNQIWDNAAEQPARLLNNAAEQPARLLNNAAAQPHGLYAQVILDIPARTLDDPFDYWVPEELQVQLEVGCCVLVDFARRPALGYVTGLSEVPSSGLQPQKIKPLREVLSTPYFDALHYQLARWIAHEYLAPLSEAIRLFTPPGALPQLRKDAGGNWGLEHSGVGPVDVRWVTLTEAGRDFVPRANAVKQREILDTLRTGQLRVSELGLSVENAAAALKSLEKQGCVRIESRRRLRGQLPNLPTTADIDGLTEGQRRALTVIRRAGEKPTSPKAAPIIPQSRHCGSDPQSFMPLTREKIAGQVDNDRTLGIGRHLTDEASGKRPVLLDGVCGSGKTEVYLQAIRAVLDEDGSAIMLVPEISLTPQTVARFRSRFGEQVAVLHSRLSPGERFDQWDMLRSGAARVAIGARSALFAPMSDLRLIVIDEEHESTYKQSSSPRYVTRDVAAKLAELSGATLVLGSATPSLEALEACRQGKWQHVSLPERTNGRPLPPIQVVDLAAEFQMGNKTMFSTALVKALLTVVERRQKAVLLLNKRGFASFLLCRDCGYVPMCEMCSTSLTLHEHPPRLVCHQCGATHPVPPVCPECKSPYLRQLGPGTQYAYDQLLELLPKDTPIVRMDADSTRGRFGHEKCLEKFIAASHGVLLGTQMIAKGLDFPEVTLVGVLIADTALKLPDFRAPERTYQLLEQVSGRAGRAELDGKVIVQTYWPEHLAIRAAALHRRSLLLDDEYALRGQLGYPPYRRLANILVQGLDLEAVSLEAERTLAALQAALPGSLTADADGLAPATASVALAAVATTTEAAPTAAPGPAAGPAPAPVAAPAPAAASG